MALAIDANNRTLKTREDLCIGEFRELADGATEKPVSVWRRLMPHGGTGGAVAGEKFKFTIGTLRASVLTVVGWNLVILEDGYQQTHRIKEVDGGVVTLKTPLDVFEGLSDLGNNVAWCVYPTLDFPLVIQHIPGMNAASQDVVLEVGFAKDLGESPTVVKYVELMRNSNSDHSDSVILPTQQVQQVFYKLAELQSDGSTAALTRTEADAAIVKLSWGEHYVRRS